MVQIIGKNAQRIPNRSAVISETLELTWQQFYLQINRMGNALCRLGVTKGDRVAICLPNSPEYLVTYFAVILINPSEIRGMEPTIGKGFCSSFRHLPVALKNPWAFNYYLTYLVNLYFFVVFVDNLDLPCVSDNDIYPREVEEVLYTHPAILEAAVVGIPDTLKGKIPKASIVLRTGMQVDESGVIAYCKKRLAAYKVPRAVEFRVELLKITSGKILKRMLMDLFEKGNIPGTGCL